MVTIRYSLKPNHLAELEAERRGGWPQRILRLVAGALFGFMGLVLVWQAVSLFPWNRPFANLIFIALGLLFLWIGFEMPGLNRLLQQLADPCAECEEHVYEGRVVTLCKGPVRQFRWLPKRGFNEKSKFFQLSSWRSGYKLMIPKDAVSREQEQDLRDIVEKEPASESPVEVSFFLTQEDLNEASAAAYPWLGSSYGRIMSRIACFLFALALPVVFWMVNSGRIPPDLVPLGRWPLIVAGFVAFELILLVGASGDIVTRIVNRLNAERRIRVDNSDISITRGTRTTTNKWERFLCYQETANLFVLRTRMTVEFVTIPKRGLQPGDEERLRTLLSNHLPDKLSAF